MTTNNLPTPKPPFWDFKRYTEQRWFNTLCTASLALAIVYVLLHLFTNQAQEYEYERLDKEQLQLINRIYFGDKPAGTDTAMPAPRMAGGVAAEPSVAGGPTPLPEAVPAVRVASNASCSGEGDTCTINHVAEFISLQFAKKNDPEQMADVKRYLRYASDVEAVSFLAAQRFRIKSYFWLVGPAVYFEIMFWSWFGVLASILFSLGMVAKNSTTDPGNAFSVFDPSEIPYQIAKLVYAPLCTLAVVLGYNFFNDQNIVDISSSKGVIVFAFVGGFFSSRLVAFLERLKELIMPLSGTTDLQARKTTPLVFDSVPLQLKLDEESIPPELRAELAELGLVGATIVLEDVQTKDRFEAVNKGEDQAPAYVVSGIKPGSYTVHASWSGTVAEVPVTLAATQTAEIKSADVPIEITLRKTEEAG